MSLPELLAALALVGLVLAGALGVFQSGLRATAAATDRAEAMQGARIALERLAREIRAAGRGLTPGLPPLAAVEPDRVALHLDVTGDGRALAKTETITWQLVGTTLRRNAGAGAQPIVEHVTALRFGYFDDAGRETADAGAVRTVSITITTAASPAPARAVAVLSTVVRLRNH